jgi:hypothetical protein
MALYDVLLDQVMKTGISEEEARLAVRRCAVTMAKQGALAYVGGGAAQIALSYFVKMNPATAIPYAVGSVLLGAGHAVYSSPDCSDVRRAIVYWNQQTPLISGDDGNCGRLSEPILGRSGRWPVPSVQ